MVLTKSPAPPCSNNFVDKTDTYVIKYICKTSGELIGLSTALDEYFYAKDILGNIIGIINKNGVFVVKYKYDPWGAILSSDVLYTADPALALNPFRYKGYVYDEETGWYYLKSRYYDPSIGRFISPDSASQISVKSITGLNLYAYCGNNPISRVDYSGHRYVNSIGTFNYISLLRKAPNSLNYAIIDKSSESKYIFVEDIDDLYNVPMDGKIYYHISPATDTQKAQLTIANSYNITGKREKSEILNHILKSNYAQAAGFCEDDVLYYKVEWSLHNLAYDVPVLVPIKDLTFDFSDNNLNNVRSSAQHVTLNTDDSRINAITFIIGVISGLFW